MGILLINKVLAMRQEVMDHSSGVCVWGGNRPGLRLGLILILWQASEPEAGHRHAAHLWIVLRTVSRFR